MALPDGSATQNGDAVRQSSLSSFFYTAPNLLGGSDSASRMGFVSNDGGASGELLGYGVTFGADVGVGNNGEIYLRGQVGAPGTTATNGQPVANAPSVSPLVLVLIVAAVVLLAK